MGPVAVVLAALACAPKAPSPTDGPPVSSPPVGVAPAAAAPAQVQADLIYFVLVDRFANGDADNDTASPGPPPDPDDPQAWHGGDLQGVIDHLDHIQALGATTVWLSPVFRTRTEPIGEWGAFHGYWQWDPFTVEPRFGTDLELVELAEALEARGMGLVLDLVTNHVGYEAPLLGEHPEWFHTQGTIHDWQDREVLENGQVHGLPDLDQDNPEVAAWLTGAAVSWRDRLTLRGYRVDAVRHVPNTFLAQLGATVRQPAPGLWWLGEDFTGDAVELAESQRSGGFSHVFDFPLHFAMTEVFCDDASPARLASVLYQDHLYDRPEGLVSFLDNHDLPRIRSRCHGDTGRLTRALVFMLSTRGVPSIQYGTEVGLEGMEEPHNRPDMRFGTTALGQLVALLMERRAATPALIGGQQAVLHVDTDSMVILRWTDRSAAIVGVNRGEDAVAVQVPGLLRRGALTGRLRQAGDGALDSTLVPAGDLASAEVPGRGVVVWTFSGDFMRLAAPEGQATVTVQARGLPDDASEVVLTGAGPLLGAWDPTAGVVLRGGPEWSAEVTVPLGAVLEGKLVVDGSWAEGDNAATLAGGDTTWVIDW